MILFNVRSEISDTTFLQTFDFSLLLQSNRHTIFVTLTVNKEHLINTRRLHNVLRIIQKSG